MRAICSVDVSPVSPSGRLLRILAMSGLITAVLEVISSESGIVRKASSVSIFSVAKSPLPPPLVDISTLTFLLPPFESIHDERLEKSDMTDCLDVM